MSVKKPQPESPTTDHLPVPDDRLTGPERGTALTGKDNPKNADGTTKPFTKDNTQSLSGIADELKYQLTVLNDRYLYEKDNPENE